MTINVLHLFVFVLIISLFGSTPIKIKIKQVITTFISAFSLTTFSLPAHPADDTWTDRNRLASEVWRKVDESYYERTFGGQDWFALRQEIVKRKYNSDEDVYKALQTMLLKIGDKYTRYLPPAQYNALMNSALGELVGIGVELEATSEGNVKIINLQVTLIPQKYNVMLDSY